MGMCSRTLGGEKPSKGNQNVRVRSVETSRSLSKILLESEHPLDEEDEEDLIETKNCLKIWKRINLRYFMDSISVKQLFGWRRSSKYNGDSYVELNVKADDEIPMPAPPRKPSWRCFTFDEICGATDNFHAENLVGRGGYSEVYKGVLPDGQMIAVKRLAKANTDERKEKEFLTELGIIGHLCHANTASLIGCCIENGLHLILQFNVHGSLDSVLHGPKATVLEWSVRYKVAIGTARGLHYLHKCCQRRIIHRDIKSSNVLLGRDFEPQISDFGLSKWLPRHWTHHFVTPIEGTFGRYLAPEYFLHGTVNEKTDVFSFGVLLLEIISGRRPIDASERNIVSWAKPLMESGSIHELVDSRLRGQYDIHQMQRMVLTASLCVRHSAVWRPSMIEVLKLLIEGQSDELADCWKMPASLINKDNDDFWEFQELEDEIAAMNGAI